MNWKVLNQIKTLKDKPLPTKGIIKALLANRGLKTEKEINEFLNPTPPQKLEAADLGIETSQLAKAIQKITEVLKTGRSITVYGDYDADGICATAIIWETLYSLTKKVLPYIPERVGEGYGLNCQAIEKLKAQDPDLGLIITVDHGITAAEKIDFAQSLGIEVIVCDHHQPGKTLPDCSAVVHTDQVCAAAITWLVSLEVQKKLFPKSQKPIDFLDLVAIASITDLEPLLGVNRSLVKYGLQALNQTKRPGLLAIFEEAGIKPGEIGTYEVGFIIGPRLNAAGRMEHALESLRLLCTPQAQQAQSLASKLGLTNRERQLITEETAKHARELLLAEVGQNPFPKLIFVSHETYQEGVIGLAAGKLTEEFYRPAIVLSRGQTYSKASARSISGFNIIEAIRAQSDLLVDAGGHPMAAGFTVETVKINDLKERLLQAAEKEITEKLLEKTFRIDLDLPLSAVSLAFWQEIKKLAPFGLGNPEPVFKSRAVIKSFRVVGATGKHLKLTLAGPSALFSAIAFNKGPLAAKLSPGQEIEVAYSLTLNRWNGNENLELKVKEINYE